VKVIQQLKYQKQLCNALLKIAENPDNFFAMALFLCPILYLEKCIREYPLKGKFNPYDTDDLGGLHPCTVVIHYRTCRGREQVIYWQLSRI
jgi:hypothetical protein